MISETPGGDAANLPRRGRPDRIGLLLALITLVLVGATAWLRYRPGPLPEPPAIGHSLPPLRLLDLETAEPHLLLGSRGKVTWVVFWSARAPSTGARLARLEAAWKRLKWHRRLTMAAAAVDSSQPEQVRAALAKSHSTLPAYLVGPETLRRFGIQVADPPLHLLVDGDGHIATIIRGAGQSTIDRLEQQVRQWLEEIEPAGEARFAATAPAEVPAGKTITRVDVQSLVARLDRG